MEARHNGEQDRNDKKKQELFESALNTSICVKLLFKKNDVYMSLSYAKLNLSNAKTASTRNFILCRFNF